jgi:hypothetical protein
VVRAKEYVCIRGYPRALIKGNIFTPILRVEPGVAGKGVEGGKPQEQLTVGKEDIIETTRPINEILTNEGVSSSGRLLLEAAASEGSSNQSLHQRKTTAYSDDSDSCDY